MEKSFTIQVSLDDKACFETKEGKEDITSEVFDYIAEAVKEALVETIDLDSDDFANSIQENYNQTLPENFDGFKKLGLKIKVI